MHDHRRTRSGLVKSHRHVLDEKHTLRRLSKVSTRVGGTEGLAQDCRMPSVDGTTTHRSSPRFAAMTATQTDSNPPRFKSIADRLLLGVSEVLLLRRADYSSNTDHRNSDPVPTVLCEYCNATGVPRILWCAISLNFSIHCLKLL